MYNFLKNILLHILPKSFVYHNEAFFRNVLYQIKYKGKNHQCNVCNRGLKQFVEHQTGLLCPCCGSLPRTRLLYFLLQNEKLADKKVLHFSPQKQLQKNLQMAYGSNYYASDFLGKITPFHFDIQNIALNDNSIDVIICYHVLEHIPDDKKAISELFRVIKPNGYGFLQVPFKEGNTIEDPTETNPRIRLEKFGQEDHLRWYNLNDFCHRLQSAGFETKQLNCSDFDFNHSFYGLNPKEVVVKILATNL